MMLVDTDWTIDYIEGRPSATRLIQPMVGRGQAWISFVTLGEIYDGVVGSRDRELAERQFIQLLTDMRPIALDLRTIRIYGQIRHDLRAARLLIGDNDLFIAATALRHDLTLVTRNRRHFDRISGLRIHESGPAE